MSTNVLRIDLVETDDIRTKIENVCEAQLGLGFKLGGSFVLGTQLILIFQKL